MGFQHISGGYIKDVYAGRNQNDAYPTPPFVTYALHYHERLPKRIWEPACGRGWMSSELIRLGYNVKSSDLYEYENPLVPHIYNHIDYTKDVPFTVDGIVTNPPYAKDLAQKFIERTIKLYPYGAFLCRLTFAESSKRLQLFTKYPPSRVLVFSQRFSCDESRFETDPLSGMVAYAWWIWDDREKNEHGKISWINTKEMYEKWKRDIKID